jgi:hypothetical protein
MKSSMVAQPQKTSIRLWVGRTNRQALMLLDQARRLLDHLGRPGIEMKRHQTNSHYQQRGYLRFVFPNRQMAMRYQHMVDEFCSPSVHTKRYRVP